MKWSPKRLGESLVELLIALAIIGILLGLFLPTAMMVYRAAQRLGES